MLGYAVLRFRAAAQLPWVCERGGRVAYVTSKVVQEMHGNAICLNSMRESAALPIFQGILDQAPAVTQRAGPWELQASASAGVCLEHASRQGSTRPMREPRLPGPRVRCDCAAKRY